MLHVFAEAVRGLDKILNKVVDRVMDNYSRDATGPAGLDKGPHPVMVAPIFKDATGAVKLRDMREDDEALHVRIDFPGLGKEDVEVTAEHNTLIIGGRGVLFRNRFTLPPERYRMDQIRAEMKDGMLKIVVPKVKEEEERKDVFKVSVK